MQTNLIDAYAALPQARRLGFRAWLARMAESRGLAFLGELSGELEARAMVNHGRWIALCPLCGGAENVTADDPVFYCLSCGNERIDGRLMPAVFPDEAERREIEAALEKRQRLNQNWLPGETVIKLVAENKAHSAGVS